MLTETYTVFQTAYFEGEFIVIYRYSVENSTAPNKNCPTPTQQSGHTLQMKYSNRRLLIYIDVFNSMTSRLTKPSCIYIIEGVI